MNKFRDLLYDKNDIFIAIIIMLIAAFIIVWRIDAIMDYPQAIAIAAVDDNTDDEKTQYSGTKDSDNGSNVRTPGSAQNDDDSNTNTGKSGYSVYINYGDSVDTVASHLVALGFFETNEQAVAAITSSGADKRLQAGTHIIPRNATPEEAVKAISTPGE